MFLSRRDREEKTGGQALTGTVTLGGNPAGAYLEGERRGMSVYAPKGYHWVPEWGDEVLVLKAGQAGEKPCVVGTRMEAELKPGQLMLSTGRAAVLLSPDGRIELTGNFTVNGLPVGPPPAPKEDKEEEEES